MNLELSLISRNISATYMLLEGNLKMKACTREQKKGKCSLKEVEELHTKGDTEGLAKTVSLTE